MSDWSLFERGFSLFPVLPNTKIPAGRWKQFMSRHATLEERADWARTPSNTAIATGAISGIIVLDCDDMPARAECERRGLSPTLTVATPRGTHFYFRHPGWEITNKVALQWLGWDRLGVDLRGDGGLIIGPGSYFKPTAAEIGKGKVEGAYRIEQDLPLADMPEWLIELTWPKTSTPTAPHRMAEETSAFGRSALNGQLDDLARMGDGQKSHQIYKTTVRIAELVAGGEITTEEGWGGLHEILATHGLEDEDKAQGTVARAWAKGMENPKSGEHREALTTEQILGTRSPVAVEAPRPEGIAPPPPDVLGVRPLVPQKMVLASDLVDYFKGVVYVIGLDAMFTPDGTIMNKSAFDGWYGGSDFVIVDGKAPGRSAWEAFRQNSFVNMPMAHAICFRPELPPGQIVRLEGLSYLNIYVPIVTPRRRGDASRFVEHVRKMLPDGRDADLLLHWMASCVQNPGKKFQWWPVIQGTKGNGKSLLLRVMFKAVGERYSHGVRADSLTKSGNQFNDWIVGKLFLGFEEIRSSEGKRDFVEIMKDSVTAERLATEGKGKGQMTSDNRANGIMLTNHDDACPVDEDERRWGVFFCAQQSEADLDRDGMGGSYFHDLYAWLDGGGYAVVTDFLVNMPLEAALDPARGLQRAPETTSTSRAVEVSRGLVEQEILEAVESGQPGFRGGVISSIAMRMLFDRLRKTIGPRRYRKIMSSIGYVTHPALEANKGRPNNALSDGSRPTLYFHKSHEILELSVPAEITAAAEKILIGGEQPQSNVVPFKR